MSHLVTWTETTPYQVPTTLNDTALFDRDDQEEMWNRKLIDLLALATLSDDWDGEGGCAPDSTILGSAVDLFATLRSQGIYPPMRILPISDGSIMLEWQTDDVYVEAEIIEPYRAEFFRREADGQTFHWVENWAKIESEASVEQETFEAFFEPAGETTTEDNALLSA